MPAVLTYRSPNNPEIRRGAVYRDNEIRRLILDFCYRIPGYVDKPLPEKNRIYDAFREILGV